MGPKDRRRPIAVTLCLLIPLCATAGCSYDYPEPGYTPTAAPSPSPSPSPATASIPPVQPYNNTQVLEQEARNYAELDRLLKAPPGPVLLLEIGPLDGPVRGFGTMEKVPAAGLYTVTAACVGASGAKVSIGQEHPGAPFRPAVLSMECTGAISQVMALEQGYVFAHLLLPGPGDTPWTGAVGGVRVTGTG